MYGVTHNEMREEATKDMKGVIASIVVWCSNVLCPEVHATELWNAKELKLYNV